MRGVTKCDKEDRYEEKIIEFRGRISRLKETKRRKNDEGIQATGANGVNNVESTQGEDRAIMLYDDAKLVGRSTGNSSGQSRHKAEGLSETDSLLQKIEVRSPYMRIILDPSACKAIVLSEASDKPKTTPVRVMNDSDDDMTLTEIARASKSRGQKKEVHVKGSSNSTRKRKRSMNEGQITSFIPELVNPGNTSGTEWSSEDDFCTEFYTDAELCLNVVCALCRQQISGNKFSSMTKIDKKRITSLGVFLCRDDRENKIKRTISEVGPEDLCICKTLVIRYSRQIYRIYNSKKYQLFCPGVVIRK